jgi:hypothetical protein
MDHYVNKGPWLRKMMAENFCFSLPEELKTTKYDPQTFNGREQNLNGIFNSKSAVTCRKLVVIRRQEELLSTSFVHVTSKTDEFTAVYIYFLRLLIVSFDFIFIAVIFLA